MVHSGAFQGRNLCYLIVCNFRPVKHLDEAKPSTERRQSPALGPVVSSPENVLNFTYVYVHFHIFYTLQHSQFYFHPSGKQSDAVNSPCDMLNY